MRFPCLLTIFIHHQPFLPRTIQSPSSNLSPNLHLSLSQDFSLSLQLPVFYFITSTSPPRIGPPSLFTTKHHRPLLPLPSLSPSVVHLWKTSHYYTQSPLASHRRPRIEAIVAVGTMERNSCQRLFDGGNFFHCLAFQEGRASDVWSGRDVANTVGKKQHALKNVAIPRCTLW